MEDKYTAYTPFSREEALNDFSHWFPKIEHCGIRVPRSIVVPIPKEDLFYVHFYMEKPEEDRAAIAKWVQEDVIPALQASPLKEHLLFVKNGRFSNKFDSRWCFTNEHELLDSIININYQSICLDAGGESEIVLRERIMHDYRVTPCMYHGMPLRSEFRVFYDFTEKKPIFTVNYWDYGYVAHHLHDLTDKIVFDYMKDQLNRAFIQKKDQIQTLVDTHMQNVEGLKGPWSVDIMLTEKGEPILIDMAIAERSAYWELRPGKEPDAAERLKKEQTREDFVRALEKGEVKI